MLLFFVGWAISRCLSTTPHPTIGQGGSILCFLYINWVQIFAHQMPRRSSLWVCDQKLSMLQMLLPNSLTKHQATAVSLWAKVFNKLFYNFELKVQKEVNVHSIYKNHFYLIIHFSWWLVPKRPIDILFSIYLGTRIGKLSNR